MSKLLVVFGATGNQGGSVVNNVLADAELSAQYKIRAITRSATSDGAAALKAKGVEVVEADSKEPATLPAALAGAHTVFGMVVPAWGSGGKEAETQSGKTIADAAVAAGAQYLIFSVLPHVSRISGGKYTKVTSFDAQAEVEDYVRTLPIRSAFFSPGSFMQNLSSRMVPRAAGDGTYVISRNMSPQARLPLIDTAGDAGKYVGAILAEPDKFEGKKFCAATRVYGMEEMAQIIGKATGKTVRYRHIPAEELIKYLPAPWGESLIEMMAFQEEFGYYGPGTEELVAWAAENARGKLHTLEDWLEENPLSLE